jgi:arylsulfatase A-like enzyme
MGGCIDNYSHFFYWAGPNRHDLWRNGRELYESGRFFGDLMVDEASQFIKQHADRPFFMYFAMNMPHYPYQGDAHWLDYYKDLEYPRNLYAAFVSTLDARIGRLLRQLDQLGLRENTLIVYQSDHGHSCEERAHQGGGSAGPYRGAKFSLFEGGIRVPAIISWPGHLPEGAVRDQMAHSCDWLPTIAELCGVELLEKDIDGRSLAKVLQSETAESPHDVVHWTIGNSWAIREGNWKLLGNPKDTSEKGPLGTDDKLFLVNLETNPEEMRNMAPMEPEIVRDLKEKHEAWMRSLR